MNNAQTSTKKYIYILYNKSGIKIVILIMVNGELLMKKNFMQRRISEFYMWAFIGNFIKCIIFDGGNKITIRDRNINFKGKWENGLITGKYRELST